MKTEKLLITGKKFTIISSVVFIGAIALFFFYVKRIDKIYHQLITKDVRTLHVLESITQKSNENFKYLYKIMLTNDKQEMDSLLIERSKITLYVDNCLDSLSSTNSNDSVSLGKLNTLINAREEYKNKTNKFVELVKNGQKAEARVFMDKYLDPYFIVYQHNIESFFAHNKLLIIKSSDAVSNDVENKSIFLLILGFSPFALATGILFLIGYIFSIMIMIYARYKWHNRAPKNGNN
ncbi:MAG: MCP four helix bundle domain-containing protein [Ignavibacteria bacterium]|nr:MCP four helix bundle domain-containing protein [Ignavibacteria bacterium]